MVNKIDDILYKLYGHSPSKADDPTRRYYDLLGELQKQIYLNRDDHWLVVESKTGKYAGCVDDPVKADWLMAERYHLDPPTYYTIYVRLMDYELETLILDIKSDPDKWTFDLEGPQRYSDMELRIKAKEQD